MDQQAWKYISDVRVLIANNRRVGKEPHEGIPTEHLAKAVDLYRQGRMTSAPKGKGTKKVTAEGQAEADALIASLKASLKPK